MLDSPYVIAALIAACVALIGCLVNAIFARQTLAATRDIAAKSLEFTKEVEQKSHERERQMERLKTELQEQLHRRNSLHDMELDATKIVLERLRDLQRSAEDTEESAIELGRLQRILAGTPSSESEDGIVDNAGDFFIAASGIFFKPPRGVPNLPTEVEGPYVTLKKSVVKVALLLDLKCDGARIRDMEIAIGQLKTAVTTFKQNVTEIERLVFRESKTFGPSADPSNYVRKATAN